MTDIIKSIGSGKDYPDPQSFFNAIPANLVAVSERWIGQVYGNVVTTGTAATGTKTTSAAFNIILEPAPGEGFKNNASVATNPLYFDASKGSTLTFNSVGVTGLDIRTPYTVIRGLQILGNHSSTANVVAIFGALNVEISGNIIHSVATSGVGLFTNSGPGNINNNLIVMTGGSASGMNSDYAGSTLTITGNTIVSSTSSSGTGVYAQSGYGAVHKNNAIFGYSFVATNASSSSSNNATNGAAYPGTSNLLNLTQSNQFVSTTDFHVKAGAALLGNGVAVAGRTTDIFGNTLASPPSIGAAEFQAPAVVISGIVGAAVADGVTTSIIGTTTVIGITGNAAANGQSVSVGNNINCSIGNTSASGALANVSSSTVITGVKGNIVCAGLASSLSNFITTDILTNNTDTVLTNTLVNYTWYPAGRIGSLSGIAITEGSGTTTSQGKLVTTISHLTSGAGVLLIAHRNNNAVDDDIAYEAFA